MNLEPFINSCILFGLLMANFWIGHYCGIRAMRKDACLHGVGEYAVDQATGKICFFWKALQQGSQDDHCDQNVE